MNDASRTSIRKFIRQKTMPKKKTSPQISTPKSRRKTFSHGKERRMPSKVLDLSHDPTPRGSHSSVPSTSIHFPMKPGQVLTDFMHELTDHEESEILGYSDIFYFGQRYSKPKGSFDDDRGDYKLNKGDHIAYRYEAGQRLGGGSFGQVYQCFDHKRQETVAVKIIRASTSTNRQAALEIKILQKLNGSPCIVSMKNYFMFRRHVCIVFELLGPNLYEFVKKNQEEGLPLSLIKHIAVQILTALQQLYIKKIVHCDLKPENILLCLNDSSSIKLVDFGSACMVSEELHGYIQSRYYRAPEVILGVPFSTDIDMWSFGCILYELYVGQPLFPGDSELDQFTRILQVIGMPPSEILVTASRKHLFFDGDAPKSVVDRRGHRRIVGSKTIEVDSDRDFVDFLYRCIEWLPQKRIKPSEALAHPCFAGLGSSPGIEVREFFKIAALKTSDMSLPISKF